MLEYVSWFVVGSILLANVLAEADVRFSGVPVIVLFFSVLVIPAFYLLSKL